MLPSFRELILDSAISSMDVNESEELSVCTNDRHIYLVDLMQLKIKKKIPLLSNYQEEEFDYYKRPIVTQNNMAYAKLDANAKEFVFTIEHKIDEKFMVDYAQHENISKVCFSQDGSFLLTGSEKGKTSLIDTSLGSLVYEFPFFADSVSSVCISDEKLFAVSASFDKSLKILHVTL